MSCECNECNPKTYGIDYNDFELEALNTSGLNPTSIRDTIFKNGFGLSVTMITEINELAQKTSHSNTWGISRALACDCESDDYNYPDPIESVQILVTNIKTQTKIDLSEDFVTYGYSFDRQLPTSEAFEIDPDNPYLLSETFQFDLTSYGSLPELAFFTINITLKSGRVMVQRTQDIIFFE